MIVSWGIGHSMCLLAVGAVLIICDYSEGGDADVINMPEVLPHFFESIVGAFVFFLSMYSPAAKQDCSSDPTWTIWHLLLHLLGNKHLLHHAHGPWHMTGQNISGNWPFMCSGNTASSTILRTATTMYVPPSAMVYSLLLQKTNSLKFRLILFQWKLQRLLMDGTSSLQKHLSTCRKASLSDLPLASKLTLFLTIMQYLSNESIHALMYTRCMPPFYPAPLSFLSSVVVPTPTV
jgi:hypothetical protein